MKPQKFCALLRNRQEPRGTVRNREEPKNGISGTARNREELFAENRGSGGGTSIAVRHLLCSFVAPTTKILTKMATDRKLAQFWDTNLASMSTNRRFAKFQNTDGDSPVYCTHIKFAIIASVTLVSVIFCNIGNQITRNASKRCQHCNRNRAALLPTAILAVSQTSLETPLEEAVLPETLSIGAHFRPALCTRSVRRH